MRAPAVNINNSYQGHVRVLPEEAAVDTDGMTWMDLDDTLRVRAVDEGVSDGSSRQVLYQVLMYPSSRREQEWVVELLACVVL